MKLGGCCLSASTPEIEEAVESGSVSPWHVGVHFVLSFSPSLCRVAVYPARQNAKSLNIDRLRQKEPESGQTMMFRVLFCSNAHRNIQETELIKS